MKESGRKRILVACNHLVSVGGAELYTYYLIKAIKGKRKYKVEYFTHHLGEISSKIENELQIGFRSGKGYDLIIASHNLTVNYLYGKGPILQICHGPIPEMEQPSPLADYHIAVSEEVKQHLLQKGFDSKVVLNGVDLGTFSPQKAIGKELKTVLSLCQSEEANKWISEICEEEQLSFKAINKHENPVFQVNKEINKADMVIGIGRSVYDAIACGRPCVLFDNRVYNGTLGDGYLHPHLFKKFVLNNCSGRYTKKSFTKQQLKQEINKYNAEDGKALRSIAERSLDLNKNTEKILAIGFSIGKWDHFKHRLSIFFQPNKTKPLFSEQKRLYRAKMKKKIDQGTSLKTLFFLIYNESFPINLQFAFYLFWLKLLLKGRKSEKPSEN
ncbi:glycosyltransferase family protein [Pleomorphovibrio marinus]|uniref:UDP-glycosyltransferase n=1 Tax=Pleomorphovibrio marinus TaxID=2164132 RepID=UPI000E0A7E74|nr:UDP-glycosyltransferase [Pleomorphovibrio marinus]